jgi:FLVCR family MFS transporter
VDRTVTVIVALLTVQLFAAAIIQGLCNNGAIPLYNEMAIESTYPVAEVCVTMVMSLVYNTLPMLFLMISLLSPEGSGK